MLLNFLVLLVINLDFINSNLKQVLINVMAKSILGTMHLENY